MPLLLALARQHLLHYGACIMQVVLFTNDTTISKGMVKYASNLSRESIIDVEGTISVPQESIAACTQSQVITHLAHGQANIGFPMLKRHHKHSPACVLLLLYRVIDMSLNCDLYMSASVILTTLLACIAL